MSSVQPRPLRQRHRRVRVLQVRGRVVFCCHGRHGQRNMQTMRGWHMVGGGQPDLPGLSWQLELISSVRGGLGLPMQPRGNRARRDKLRVVSARGVQGKFGLCRVHGLPAELRVGRRKQSPHQLSVPRGVHGTRRRGLRGVCSGEVQGGGWLCRMHRLRRRHVPRHHRSLRGQHLHKLPRGHVLHGTGRF